MFWKKIVTLLTLLVTKTSTTATPLFCFCMILHPFRRSWLKSQRFPMAKYQQSPFHWIFSRFLLKNAKKKQEKMLKNYINLVDRALWGLKMTKMTAKNGCKFRHVWLHFLSPSRPFIYYSSLVSSHHTFTSTVYFNKNVTFADLGSGSLHSVQYITIVWRFMCARILG